MQRRVTLALSGVALAALAWPAIDPSPGDSLPVSSYPMFARPKERVSTFAMVVVRDADGRERRLDPREVGGTDQPMQAAMAVSQAIRSGAAGELCAEIAARLDEPGTVEVLTATHDAIAWFRGREQPLERQSHAQCPAGGDP